MTSNIVSQGKHARLKPALVCTTVLAGLILFAGPTISAHADTDLTPTTAQNSGTTTTANSESTSTVVESDNTNTGNASDNTSGNTKITDISGTDTGTTNSDDQITTDATNTTADTNDQQNTDATVQPTTTTTDNGPVATTDSHNQSLNDPLTSQEMYYYEPTNDPTEDPWATAVPIQYLNNPNDASAVLPYDDPGYDATYSYPTAKGWTGYVYYFNDNPARGTDIEKAGWYPLTTYVDNDPAKGYKMPQFEDPKHPLSNTYLKILPDPQQAVINFVDADDNSLLHQVVAWNGKTSSVSTYDPQIAINGYLAQGFKLVSNDFVKNFKYDNIADGQGVVSQTFIIMLKSSATTETKTITRTINYLDKQTQAMVADPANQSVTFTRISTTNGLTGVKTYTPWTTNEDVFTAVTSPDLTAKGYSVPDKAVVETLTVTPDANNIVVNVYYTKVITTTPGNPGVPNEPDQPSQPSQPGQPTTTPTEPETPTTPQTPTNPVVPVTPENPISPDTPTNSRPVTPTTPEAPTEPETSQTENNQTVASQDATSGLTVIATHGQPKAQVTQHQATSAISNDTTLPQTAETNHPATSLFGLIGLAFAGLLGFDLKRHRN